MLKRNASLACYVAIGLSVTVCQAQVIEARLTPDAPITSDIFGYDVDFDGTTVLGGAPFGTFGGFALSGRAFVFERVEDEWEQTELLLPSVQQSNAFFGVRVAIDGSTLAIAATGEDVLFENQGAVYIFERSGGVWNETARLVASDGTEGASFGGGLAMQGDALMVGAAGDSNAGGDYAGAVYVYERVGGVWTDVAKLTASDPAFDDNFGAAVALDGDFALIGAIDDDHSGEVDPGAAYIFEKTGGLWQEVTKLTASDPGENAFFGATLALGGDTAVVGAEEHSHSDLDEAGTVYVFERDGDKWPEVARLTAFDADAGDLFGVDVSLDAGRILVGSFLDSHATGLGSAYLYRRDADAWDFDSKLVASDTGGILFGWRLALSGDQAAVSGPFYQTNRGAVYMVAELPEFCEGDANGDGLVDPLDSGFVLARFGCEVNAGDPNCDIADMNGDGLVDPLDSGFVLARFGKCP